MTKKEDYGLDTPAKILPIIIMNFDDKNEKVRLDKLQINKIICHFEKITNSNEIEFRQFKLGFVSYEVSEDLEMLTEYGLLDKDENENYFITPEGQEAAKELLQDFPKEKTKALSEAYELRKLSSDELLFFMYKTYPESKSYSIVYFKLSKNDMKLVQGIYDKGLISASTALQWVSEEDRDKLDLNVKEEYSKKLEKIKKEKTVKPTEVFSICG
jgi:hypothetical protein